MLERTGNVESIEGKDLEGEQQILEKPDIDNLNRINDAMTIAAFSPGIKAKLVQEVLKDDARFLLLIS